MTVVAVIQARMESSRLPGKVMLPLACDHVLEHIIRRTESAETVDEVVVATSKKCQNSIVARCAARLGAETFRGSEFDVLGRIFEAASAFNAEIVVRVTADCPLMSHRYIDVAVEHLREGNFDYVSSPTEGTFPIGVSSEVFTYESFINVESASTDPSYREHVTPYYYKNEELFSIDTIMSTDVFDETVLQNRSELRLTLDEPDDYELFRRIYDSVEFDEILPLADAVSYIDTAGIVNINSHVSQKQVSRTM
jgi:spore coat polysaccharide biosynthesis protein SpsF